MIEIRTERPNDHCAISEVIVDAFTGSAFGYGGEAELVQRLRGSGVDFLSLVAAEGTSILGHIFFSPVTICGQGRQLAAMGLAPMAVAPARQGCGIGSKLIREGLRRLQAARCPAVFVLGHPQYYPRFGFVPAMELGIQHGFEGLPQEAFFVIVLERERFDTVGEGIARFHDEFGEQKTL